MTSEEIELKAGLAPEVLAQLRKAMGGKARRLVSLYFDTPDHRLRRAGIALRVRRSGDVWTQTVKVAAVEARHGLQRVGECEAEVGAPVPDMAAISDEALREKISMLLDGAALKELFTIDVLRTTALIEMPSGMVEVALDEGAIRARGHEAAISEAEFELKSGKVQAVFDCAAEMIGGQTARFFLESKAKRGARLLAEEAPVAVTPFGTGIPKEGLSASVEGAFHDLLALYGRGVADNLCCTMTSTTPEGPHQLRVSLRRLRAALAAFRPVIKKDLRRDLARQARDLGRIVSPLRDADALIEDVIRPAAEENDPALPALEVWRRQVRAETRTKLQSARATGFAIELLGLLHGEGWKRPGEEALLAASADTVLRPALKTVWKKARRRGKHLDDLSAPERHELRKDLKVLRYVAEVAISDHHDPFLVALRRLQTRLGQLNDLATLARVTPTFAKPAPRQAFEAIRDRLIAEQSGHDSELMEDAVQHWASLEAAMKRSVKSAS